MNLANYITFSTKLLKYHSTCPKEFTVCVSTSNILPSPSNFLKLVKNFLCGGEKGRILLFWSFFLICLLKEEFFHFRSWAFSLAFKFMTEPVNYSVTSTSSGKFWHLSLACCTFLWFFPFKFSSESSSLWIQHPWQLSKQRALYVSKHNRCFSRDLSVSV